MDQYSERAQRLLCLLYALRELKGNPRKQEVLCYVREERFLDLNEDDFIPYDTQTEDKWKTDLAWRRKDGVQWGHVFNNQRDSWEITRHGRDLVDLAQELSAKKEYDVTRCYLWSAKLKRIFDPNYQPSTKDKRRPRFGRTKRREPLNFYS